MSDVPRTPDPSGSGSRGEGASPLPPTSIEGLSPEIERPAGSARLPGARRDGYTKLPTGPVGIEPVVVSRAEAGSGDEAAPWEPPAAPPPADEMRLAPWALFAAIVALGASFFVGWGIPVAVVAVIASVMALRRPAESRAMARWALVLSLTATVYSLGWLVWAGMQFERIG